jgi:hypothetical protein
MLIDPIVYGEQVLASAEMVQARACSAVVIGCTMIAIPLRSFYRRRDRVGLCAQAGEQLVEVGEMLRIVRLLDRDQRRAQWRTNMLAPEPQ